MPQKKILIVDDSQQIRKSLRDILEKHQYDIVGEANNGMEAINLCRELQPDIIMLDIIMPQLGGIETVRMVRAIPSIKKDTKIIMVSALGTFDRIKECMKAGANHYILKPFDEKKVIEIIEKLFE